MFSKSKSTFKQRHYFKKIFNFYWTSATCSKELPTEGLPFVGSLFSLIMAGSSPKLHLYIDAKHKRLGPVFRETVLGTSTIFLSDPDKIREVFSLEGKCPSHILPNSWLLYNQIYRRKRGLLFMENEEWQHYRKIMNMLLLKDGATDDLSTVYEDIVSSLVNKWKELEGTGKYLETVDRDMYMHSLSFMMATVLGSSYKQQKQHLRSDLENLAMHYHKIFETTSKLMVVPVTLACYLNLSSWTSFVSSMDKSLLGSEQIISKMKQVMSGDGLMKKLLDTGISEKMAMVLLIDLMIAAGDTTAYTLQWALYLLGKHRSIQDQVRKDEELIKGVIKETLRLYPAAPFLSRKIQYPLEVSGFHIPAQEMVVMSMYTSGRSESNFLHANNFLPDRWTRNNGGHTQGIINKFASLPFAIGVRSCVGKKLAEMFMISTIKAILSNYKITAVNNVDMILRLTPAPTERIKLLIETL